LCFELADPTPDNMGKPLKQKALSSSGSLRSAVLSRQGVKINKRKRLGHSGHFGKITEVPIDRKPKDKKAKSKFNKFKQDGKEQSEGEAHGGKRDQQLAGDDESAASRPHGGGDGGKSEKASDDRVQRLPGESFCKFMKRLNRETTEKLIEQSSKARKVRRGLFLCVPGSLCPRSHADRCQRCSMAFKYARVVLPA
jgi:hypothetical protein